MRLKDAPAVPSAATLGNSADEKTVYDHARSLADDCRSTGINVVLGPVLDVESDPKGFIGRRSFGADPETVSRLGIAYAPRTRRRRHRERGKAFPRPRKRRRGQPQKPCRDRRRCRIFMNTRSSVPKLHIRRSFRSHDRTPCGNVNRSRDAFSSPFQKPSSQISCAATSASAALFSPTRSTRAGREKAMMET